MPKLPTAPATMLASLALVASLSVAAKAAVTEDNFKLQSAGDLAALCSADKTDPLATAAANYCEGYALGAYAVIDQYQRAEKTPLFCLPNPPPTRDAATAAYAAWVKASPARPAMAPVDSVYEFLRTQYPCTAKKP
jgi:hypothetical protein